MAVTGTAGTSTMRSMRSRSGPESSASIAGNLCRRAAAAAMLVAEEPAGAGVHRSDEHEPGREDGGSRGTSDRDAAFLERLAQHLEHAPIELRHLVEEEHAVVRERDLTRARDGAAADERDVRHGVMRRAERPFTEQANARRQRAGDRVDRRALQRLVEGERRKDRPQPPRHHRLARARRPGQQQVVTAGSGDLERARAQQLSADVGEVAFVSTASASGCEASWPRDWASSGLLSASTASGSDRAMHTSRPSTTLASAAFCGGSSSRFSPRRRAATAIGSTPRMPLMPPSSDSSPTMTVSSTARRVSGPDVASSPSAIGRSNDEPALRTSAGARLTVMRWCGNSKPGVADRRPDAVAALADGRVGQPHHREVGQAEGDIDLDVDGIGFDAEHGGAAQAGEHDARRSARTGAARVSAGFSRISRRWAASVAHPAIPLGRRVRGFARPLVRRRCFASIMRTSCGPVRGHFNPSCSETPSPPRPSNSSSCA